MSDIVESWIADLRANMDRQFTMGYDDGYSDGHSDAVRDHLYGEQSEDALSDVPAYNEIEI